MLLQTFDETTTVRLASGNYIVKIENYFTDDSVSVMGIQ